MKLDTPNSDMPFPSIDYRVEYEMLNLPLYSLSHISNFQIRCNQEGKTGIFPGGGNLVEIISNMSLFLSALAKFMLTFSIFFYIPRKFVNG